MADINTEEVKSSEKLEKTSQSSDNNVNNNNQLVMKIESLKDINVILNASERNLKKFGDQLFDVASKTGQSFFEVSKAAGEFARQGLSMEKTITRTRDALILMRLSGMDAEASVNSLTAAINSFSSAALNSTQIVNRLANVDAAFAVSSNDLAEAIRRVNNEESISAMFL